MLASGWPRLEAPAIRGRGFPIKARSRPAAGPRRPHPVFALVPSAGGPSLRGPH